MTDSPDHTCRGEFHFECGSRDCPGAWKGDDLASIAKRVARHYNREHNDELEHGYERIDTIERGGHHVHGNEYTVTRIPVYVTSFDVMERIGCADGLAVPANIEQVCDECSREIPDPDDRIEPTVLKPLQRRGYLIRLSDIYGYQSWKIVGWKND